MIKQPMKTAEQEMAIRTISIKICLRIHLNWPTWRTSNFLLMKTFVIIARWSRIIFLVSIDKEENGILWYLKGLEKVYVRT